MRAKWIRKVLVGLAFSGAGSAYICAVRLRRKAAQVKTKVAPSILKLAKPYECLGKGQDRSDHTRMVA